MCFMLSVYDLTSKFGKLCTIIIIVNLNANTLKPIKMLTVNTG